MSMNDHVVDMNYPGGEGSSRNAINNEVEAHGEYLSKETYDTIKHNTSDWRDIINFLQQKSPMGNTVLHIAATYGNEECVENITKIASHYHLLTAKNANGDTPLHVAARAGQISTLKNLLTALLGKLPHSGKPKEALDEILVKNKQGNNFFHEALMNGHKDVMSILDSQEQKQIKGGFRELVVGAVLLWTNYKGVSVLHLAIWKGFGEIVDEALTILTKLTHQDSELFQLVNNNQDLARVILSAILAEKSSFRKENQEMLKDWENYRELGLLISRHFSPDKLKMEEKKKKEEGGEKKKKEEKKSDPTCLYCADMIMQRDRVSDRDGRYSQLASSDNRYVLHARSPLIVAILKQDQGILRKMLEKKKEWIHLKDSIGRTVLHHAAYIGYLNGVEELLGNCTACSMEKDKYGHFPLHSASEGGHVEVIKKLLEYCPDPTEIVDNYGRNILHIAAGKGKLSVVRYILQNDDLEKMINDKDAYGNTPLHMAAMKCHPKIVYALTRDKRVDLSLINNRDQTALDICIQYQQKEPSLRQRLTWAALKSAGAQYAKRESMEDPLPPQRVESYSRQESTNMDPYKDRINTLMLVATLITTVTFAAGFTLPGGTNSTESDPEQGMALMLHNVWFKLFIFCITISMYGSISVTVILIWAQLGDITLALFALKMARPFLGVTLATLSVAFMAGVHLVISKLSWLATTNLALCLIFILMLLLLYIILWLPSWSNNPAMLYISYYPFQFLTWLVEDAEIKMDPGAWRLTVAQQLFFNKN